MQVRNHKGKIYSEIKDKEKLYSLFKSGAVVFYTYLESKDSFGPIRSWFALEYFVGQGNNFYIYVGKNEKPSAVDILEFLQNDSDIFSKFGQNKIAVGEVIELWKKQKSS